MRSESTTYRPMDVVVEWCCRAFAPRKPQMPPNFLQPFKGQLFLEEVVWLDAGNPDRAIVSAIQSWKAVDRRCLLRVFFTDEHS
jgi:hypothetical protein